VIIFCNLKLWALLCEWHTMETVKSVFLAWITRHGVMGVNVMIMN